MKHTTFKGDWRKVFGEEYQVPEVFDKEYLDQSHKNSLCPSFLIGHKGDQEITVWIERPDPRKKTGYGQEKRFVFMGFDTITCEHCYYVETDNEEFAIKHARLMREYLNRNKIPGTKAKPVCPMCANREMASMGTDIICSECHTKCGETA